MTRILWIVSLLFFVASNIRAQDKSDPKGSSGYPEGQGTSSVPQINESATAPRPLLEEELEPLLSEGQKKGFRKKCLTLALGISLPVHGVFSSIHIGVVALGRSWGWGHNNTVYAAGLNESDFKSVVIVAPILGVGALLLSSAIASRVAKNSFFSKSKFLPIFGLGFVGLGLSTALMWAMVPTDSAEAFMSVTCIGYAILPAAGELLGYIVSRKAVNKTRLWDPGRTRRPHHVKPQLLPPFPLVLVGMGRARLVPGLTLGTLVF